MSNAIQTAAAKDARSLSQAIDSAESLCEKVRELKTIVDDVSDGTIEIDEDTSVLIFSVATTLTHRLDSLSLIVRGCINALQKSQL